MTDDQFNKLMEKLEEIHYAIRSADSSSEISSANNELYTIRNEVEDIKKILENKEK